jgi:hypothetical protein
MIHYRQLISNLIVVIDQPVLVYHGVCFSGACQTRRSEECKPVKFLVVLLLEPDWVPSGFLPRLPAPQQYRQRRPLRQPPQHRLLRQPRPHRLPCLPLPPQPPRHQPPRQWRLVPTRRRPRSLL